MINTLLRLFDNDNFMSRFENALKSLDERLKQELKEISVPMNAEAIFSAVFKDNGDNYELKINLNEGITESDINVEIEDDETVKITAEHKDENSSFKMVTMTTIPDDADADTLTAELVDNKVVINVKKVEKDTKENKVIKVTKK